MSAFFAVSERLQEKSIYHHFDTQFVDINLSICTAYDKNGMRDFKVEDFVGKNDLAFQAWKEQFADDIKNNKVDYSCPYFWDRWDYVAFHAWYRIDNYTVIERIIDRNRYKRRSANGKKSWIKRKKLTNYCKVIDELLPLDTYCHLNDESWADILYNAFLLEKSTISELHEVNDSVNYNLTYDFLTNNLDRVTVNIHLAEFLEFAKFIQNIRTYPIKELTAQSMIDIYQLLVPDDNVRNDENYFWRGKIHQESLQFGREFLNIVERQYRDYHRKKHPLLAIANLFQILMLHKPFYKYNEIFAIAILNLELVKYGYPTISIRRRDIFFVENCLGEYYIHEDKPQDYVELVLYYLLNEMNYLKDNAIVPSRTNKYLKTDFYTDICQEHFDWWHALTPLWQRILLVCANHQDKLEAQVDEYLCGDTDVSFYLNYPIPKNITAELLQKIFQLTHIAYDRNDVNPSLVTVVDYIPPLHYFKHLQHLSLQENYVHDLSGLNNITTLKYLDLHENCNDDNEQLTYVGTLKSLEYLELSINFFTDVSPLTKLTNLTYLSMWGGARQPIDINGFENLQKLEVLDMDAPVDMTPLAQLKNLKELDFGTDEYEFNDANIDYLLEQLPNCDISFETCTTYIRREPQG